MPTPLTKKIESLDFLIANVANQSEKIIYANEDKIIDLNLSQIEKGQGADDRPLINENAEVYSGFYTAYTQKKAAKENPIYPKVAGKLYNFAWTGDYLSSYKVEVKDNASKIIIRAADKGYGGKKAFLDGYSNIEGLNKRNIRKLDYEIIKPELQKFINRYI